MPPTKQLGRRTRSLWFMLGPAAIIGSISCGEKKEEARPTILIGFLTDAGDLASNQGRAAELLATLRQFNDAGGLELGDGTYQLDLVSVDQGETPQETAEALERLAERGVTVTVGPSWSSLVLGKEEDHSDGAAAKAQEMGMVLISGSATAEAITNLDDDDLMWRTVASDVVQAKVAADLAYNGKGARTVSILYRDDAWGRGLAAGFEREFEAQGGSILASAAYPTEDDPVTYNYSSHLEDVFAGSPDALYLVAFDEALAIGNQLVSGGHFEAYEAMLPPIIGTDGFYSSDLPINMPAEVLDRLSGTITTRDASNPSHIEYIRLMEEAGFLASETDSHRADALILGVLAMQAASSTDADAVKAQLRPISTADVGDVTIRVGQWERAKEVLLAGGTIDYEGAGGPIEFSAQGDVTRGTVGIWHAVRTDEGHAIETEELISFDLTAQ